jgi:urea transport system ATP-binding protein
MLKVSELNIAIGGSQILRGVSFEVPQHSVFCLMGRNGVGKTTTLKGIVGLQSADSGTITLEGKDISRMRPDQRARSGIAYVPQGRDIFPHLTVAENLEIGMKAQNKNARRKEKLERVFGLFPILKEFLTRKGGNLSGGQQQQLAIGRALLTEPHLLILDEPTEGIQPNIIDQIGETIKMLRSERSMSILLVEQYLDFCKELADCFAIMDRGNVVARGTVAELTDEVVKTHLTV